MGFLDVLSGVAERFDDWVNPFTGFGSTRDRTKHTSFIGGAPLPKEECAALYHQDDLAARIVDTLPKAMTRRGWRVFSLEDESFATMKEEQLFSLSAKNPPAVPPTPVERELDRIDLRNVLTTALSRGRCMGGAVIDPGITDSQSPELPLKLSTDGSPAVGGYASEWRIYDARHARPKNGVFAPHVGVQVYELEDPVTGARRYVHASRLLVTRGAPTAERERMSLEGWDYSVLQKAYEPLRQFNQAYKGAEVLMTDSSQGVFKMKNLLQAIATNRKLLEARAQILDMGRSSARAIFIDSDGEDYSKVATSFAGIPDTMDRFANRLAAASEIPVTLLMGQAPAGLNATGESDIRLWYDVVEGEQDRILMPLILRAAMFVAAARAIRGPFGVRFASLWQETPRQSSEREDLESRSDDRRIKCGILTPGEVRAMRYGLDPAKAPGLAQAQAFGAGGNVAQETSGGEPEGGAAALPGAPAPAALPAGRAPIKLTLAPTDMALVVTMNEARASSGLPRFPGPDGDLTLTAYKAKIAGTIATAAAAEAGETAPSPPAEAGPPAPGPAVGGSSPTPKPTPAPPPPAGDEEPAP
jgi:uncharacterized protein